VRTHDAELLKKMPVAKCANPLAPDMMVNFNFAMLAVQFAVCTTIMESAACGLLQDWGKRL